LIFACWEVFPGILCLAPVSLSKTHPVHLIDANVHRDPKIKRLQFMGCKIGLWETVLSILQEIALFLQMLLFMCLVPALGTNQPLNALESYGVLGLLCAHLPLTTPLPFVPGHRPEWPPASFTHLLIGPSSSHHTLKGNTVGAQRLTFALAL
jgi:hypothetical protein